MEVVELNVSRSKRAPVYTEGYGSPDKKKRKRRANRKVRQNKDIADGGAFRKESSSWEITDYKFRVDGKKDKKATRK